jgi:tetratricopeptide (TPR) repeat protein
LGIRRGSEPFATLFIPVERPSEKALTPRTTAQPQRSSTSSVAFQTALAKEPDLESALTGAAQIAAQGARRDDAIAYWRRAIAISPWRADYHAELALLYFQGRASRAAAEASRNALRLNPADLEIR